jgi:hypothetical protein
VPLHQTRDREQSEWTGRATLAEDILNRIKTKRTKALNPIPFETTNFGHYLLRITNGVDVGIAAPSLVQPAATRLTERLGLQPAATRSTGRLSTGIARQWRKSEIAPEIAFDGPISLDAREGDIPPLITLNLELGNLSLAEDPPAIPILVSSDEELMSNLCNVATPVASRVSSTGNIPRDHTAEDFDFFENFEALSPLPPNFVADSPTSRWDVLRRKIPFLFDPVARTMTLWIDPRTCDIGTETDHPLSPLQNTKGTQTDQENGLTLQDLRSELRSLLPYFI